MAPALTVDTPFALKILLKFFGRKKLQVAICQLIVNLTYR
jgi:hypothetical protein